MNYRSESFLNFVIKTRLPFFFGWVLNAGIIFILITYLIFSYDDKMSMFWNTFTFILVCFVVLKLFIYLFAFSRYKLGNKAYDELGYEEKRVFNDIKIYIKGFDLFEMKKFFPPNFRSPTYEFNKADVIVTKQCMILLGKIDWYGGIWYDAAIEITNGARKTSLLKVSVTDLVIKEKNFEVEIIDPNFKKPILIEF